MITMHTLQTMQSVLDPLEWLAVERVIMHDAFNSVAPRDDWRKPIDATVDVSSLGISPQVVALAVAYMTSTEASVEENARGMVRVRAAGYRAGPAGP